jgi:hypothetical protein
VSARILELMRTTSSGKMLGIQGLASAARQIVGNTLFDETVPARHLKDAAKAYGDQVIVLSGKRRVDSGHILFK